MKKLTKKTRKEIAAYVRENVEDYELRLQLALNRMDRLRCSLSVADDSLYDDIVDAIDDWCMDNDIIASDEFVEDWDEFIEGDNGPGIIWEE